MTDSAKCPALDWINLCRRGPPRGLKLCMRSGLRLRPRMRNLALVGLYAANFIYYPAAEAEVDAATAAQVYAAAETREQMRPAYRAMPTQMRKIFAMRGSFTEERLAAVEAATETSFREEIFEPVVIGALATNLDSETASKALEFLGGSLGRRLMAAQIALARLDQADTDRIMLGETAVPSTPQRDAMIVQIEQAAKTAETTAAIFMTMEQAVFDGSVLGTGNNLSPENERLRKKKEVRRVEIESQMREPLRRFLTYGYRDLSNDELAQILNFIRSTEGRSYVQAYFVALQEGYEAMGKSCGIEIAKKWQSIK